MHHTAAEDIAAGMAPVGRRALDWEAAVHTGLGEGEVAGHIALVDADQAVVHSYPEEGQVVDHTDLVEDQAVVVRTGQAGEHRRAGSDTVLDVAGLGEDTETGPEEERRMVEEDTGLAGLVDLADLADLADLGTARQEAVVVRTRSTAVVLAGAALADAGQGAAVHSYPEEDQVTDHTGPAEVPGRKEVGEGSCRGLGNGG